MNKTNKKSIKDLVDMIERQKQIDETPILYNGKALDKDTIINWIEQLGIFYTLVNKLVSRYDNNVTIEQNRHARYDIQYGSLSNIREVLRIIDDQVTKFVSNTSSDDRVIDVFEIDKSQQGPAWTRWKKNISDLDDGFLHHFITSHIIKKLEDHYELPHRQLTTSLIRTCIKDDCSAVKQLLNDYSTSQRDKLKTETIN